MQTAIPYIIQGDNIVIYHDGQPYTIKRDHINYDLIVQAIKNQAWDDVPGLLTVKATLNTLSCGLVEVTQEEVKYQGVVVENTMTQRMLSMLQQGFSIAPFVAFMENLYKNPSHRAVNELYGFLESSGLPLTEDGHFLAYKRVRSDFKDVYSGTMDNSPGKIVEMPRYAVNDNKDETCSTGLHFCGFDYLQRFSGDRIVMVKINPADVVSIPSDYKNQKGRACRYEVVEEITVEANGGDILKEGPAVAKTQKTVRATGSVEKIWGKLSEQERIQVLNELYDDFAEDEYLFDCVHDSDLSLGGMLDEFTYTEIRIAMRRVGVID